MLGDGFAPCGHGNHNGSVVLFRFAQFQALPGLGRVGIVLGGVFKISHFLAHPAEPAEFFEFLAHLQVGIAQVGHVAQGVDQLFRTERAPRPIGELARLVDLPLEHALHEIVIRDRIAEAERHGGDLRVEDRAGGVADQAIEDFKVLPGGVKHLHPVVGGDQVEEGTDVQIFGQWVDQAFHAGRRGLYEAEFRPVCRFPVKLGIDADKVGFSQFSAQVFQCRLFSNGSQGVVSHRGLAYRIALTNASA